MAQSLQIGFIGLGDMGAPIAERIVDSSWRLIVSDLRPEAVDRLVASGALAASQAAELASACDIIFLCLVDDRQVLALVQDQLAASMRQDAVLVILSSVLPQTVREVARVLEKAGRGGAVLDAPVSGSRPAAASGTLTLIVGGDAAVLAAVRPVLESFSSSIFHTGPLGSGQTVKIANNVILHMNHLVALEASRFAKSQGIDEKLLIEVVNASSGRSWVTETWGLIDGMFRDHPQAGTPGIYGMMVKEMWNAILLARESATPLPLTALGVQVSRDAYADREHELGIDHPAD